MQQIPLFDRPTLNTCKDQKLAMNLAVRQNHLSREEIIDEMNDLATRYGVNLVSNGSLKLETFEKWINPNDLSRQMPTRALPVFCAVVQDTSALDILARPLGARVIGYEDQNRLRWAKAYFKAREYKQEMRAIEKEL